MDALRENVPGCGLPPGRADRGQPGAGAGGRRPGVGGRPHRASGAGTALLDMRSTGGAGAAMRGGRTANLASRPTGSGRRAELEAALVGLRSRRAGPLPRRPRRRSSAPRDDEHAVALGRDLLRRRTIAATIGATGRDHRRRGRRGCPAGVGAGAGVAAAADRAPRTGCFPRPSAAASITSGFLAGRAVAVRNSLRTGLGLALGGRRHPSVPGRTRVLGGARARCRCCAAAR